jgi:hypothetical protein
MAKPDERFDMGKRNCTVPGCDGKYRSRGMCSIHYDRWRKSVPKAERQPLPGLRERFFTKTRRDPASGCLIWTGALDPRGYGRLGVTGRRTVFAHRLALEWRLGRSLEPGLEACHRCDTPACVEANHLYEGTRQQNVNDCTRQRRHAWGAANGHHKLSPDDVREIRRLLQTGQSQRGIAARFDVHPSVVSRINSGRRWQHLAA